MRGAWERVEMKWNVLKKILLGDVDGVEGGERQRRVRELVFESHFEMREMDDGCGREGARGSARRIEGGVARMAVYINWSS